MTIRRDYIYSNIEIGREDRIDGQGYIIIKK